MFLYFVIFFILLNVSSNNSQTNANPTNILLLIIDDLRPTIRSFGDSIAITPNIDKLARTGIIFNKAFAQQALCGPSRTSFLTSRRPDTTRQVDVHYYWRKHAGNYSTLPQYFKENGYDTQSVGKIFHPGISSNHNDDQPFSWSSEPYHPSTQKYKNSPVCLGNDGRLHSNIYCPVQVSKQPEKTLPDIQSTEFALQWLQTRAEKERTFGCKARISPKPFLLAVGFHKPHIPLKFPMEFLDLYPIDTVPLAPNRFLPKGLPLSAWNPWNDLRRRHDISSLNVSFPFGPIPDFYSRYIRQGYYAATSYTDSLIGLIVSQTKYLFPNTIIALFGDHGWSLGEHQEWSKFSNFEVSTRVPLVFSLSTKKPFVTSKEKYVLKNAQRLQVTSKYFKTYIKKSNIRSFNTNSKDFVNYQTYNGVVELLDLYPTLVDLAGLPSLPKCPLYSFNISICTEGKSLSCIINSYNKKIKDAKEIYWNSSSCSTKVGAVSQYPRPGIFPSVDPDSDQPRLNETKIMGYSLRTNRYRYTLWLKFNYTTFDKDFSNIYGEELYDHLNDDEENINLIYTAKKPLKTMRKLLENVLIRGA